MISSLQNPLVKQIRKLHSAKGRREQGLFLIEGTHLLETASGEDCSLLVVCYTQTWCERYPQLWKTLLQKSPRVELVSPDVLGAIATTVNPDGVVAIMSRQTPQETAPTGLSLGLVLERLQDPGNLGTIIRTSVATKVECLWLSHDTVDLDNPKVIRASAGEWFRLSMQVSASLPTVIENYRASGVQIVATIPQAAKTYWEVNFENPTMILLGNEGGGLSGELISLADEQVRIPLAGGVESLNVAIAAALLLYEVQRQRLKT